MDLFPQTSGTADIQMDVSSHVETVVLLDREKADGDVGIDLDIKKPEGTSRSRPVPG